MCVATAVVSDSLQPYGLWLGSCPRDSLGKNTGGSRHVVLQRIFPTQGSSLRLLCLLHLQTASLPQGHLGSPNCKLSLIMTAQRGREDVALPDPVFLFGSRDIPPNRKWEPPGPSAATSAAPAPKCLCILATLREISLPIQHAKEQGAPGRQGSGEDPMTHRISHPTGFSLQFCRLFHQLPWCLPPDAFQLRLHWSHLPASEL